MMIRWAQGRSGKLTFLAFFLLIFLLTGFVSAQGGKTPDATITQEFFRAPQKFDRVDRNKNKILDDLEGLIEPGVAQDRFDVIVMLEKPLDILPEIKGRHGDFSETFTYPAINGFAANLTKGQILAFADDDDIKQIEHDALAYPHLDTAQEWFGTTKSRADFGVDGDAAGDGLKTYSTGDIVIAILDTGIDPNHVDLGPNKIIAWRDATINNDQSGPYDELGDCDGHGSHVASIATGEGDGDSDFVGVAPGAALVGVKVLSNRNVPRQGNICTAANSEILSGIQWVIDNKATYGINVANMSLGVPGCSDGTDTTSALVNSAVDTGIVMVVSAGNAGPGTCTVGSPGVAADALTVGAMADVFPRTTSASFSCGPAPYVGFNLSCFSSRGPTAPDDNDNTRIKPDVGAPGMFINAVEAGTTNGYTEKSGTSMSAPFTAGVAGLILDAHPAHTPAQVKSTIESTAFDWGLSGKDIEYGSGRMQGYEAIKSAGSFSGTNVDTPTHVHLTGTVASGGFDEQSINVTDASLPIAATMIITSGSGTSPDLDLEIRDSGGNPLFSCSGSPFSTTPCPCTSDSNGICKSRSVQRQETVGFQPTSTGIYKLRAVSFSGGGDYFVDVSFGQPAVAISLTTDGDTPFGVVALGGTIDTTSSGTNDVQTIQVDAGPADLSVKSTSFSDGSNTWTLSATNGSDQILWEFSKDATTWADFTSADTLFSLDTNVAQAATRDLYLRLTMPTTTLSNSPHSATVTIVATAP